MVKVWYPAEKAGTEAEVYIEPSIAASFASQHGFPAFVSSHLPRIQTHRYATAPLANDKQQYPVLLFSHGLRVPVVFYSAFLEELASQGYIIFCLQHTYETAGVRFPEGRLAEYNAEAIPVGNRWDQVWQINQDFMAATDSAVRVQKVYEMNEVMPTSDRVRAWAEDIHFLLDELERMQNQPKNPFYGRLSLAQVGGFGHSMGGAAMAQAMLQDARIKAGANWDGGQWGDLIGNRINRPFLALDAVRDPANYPFMLMNPIIYAEADMPQLSYMQLDGTGHCNFSDMAFLSPLRIVTEAGPIDPARSIELVNKLTLSFFNTHLRQQGKFLTGELKHPEIRHRQ